MTTQTPEKILIEGKALELCCTPGFPRNSPYIEDLEEKFSDPRIGYDPEFAKNIDRELYEESISMESTACWRGYVGTWEIRDGKLFLVNIRGKYLLLSEKPIWANWVTGKLILPESGFLGFFDAGFGPQYSVYKYISVEKGMIMETEIKKGLMKYKRGGSEDPASLIPLLFES